MNRRTLLKYGTVLPLVSLALNVKAEHQEIIPKRSITTVRIQRLAWAGIKIEVGSTTLFIDATSYDEYKDNKLGVETEFRHAIITHHHPDHYDPVALKTVFDKRSRLYCYEKTLPWLDTRDLRMQAVKLYQPVDASRWMGDLVAIPVPAVDGFGHPQVSWVVQGGGKKIIHCGDTLWHGYWRDIAIAYGPFDIAFMPINAARLNQGQIVDAGIPAVMDPEQAVVASKLLNAKRVCPIHYGRAGENYFEIPEPEKNFLRFAEKHRVPPLLLEQGEFVKWD